MSPLISEKGFFITLENNKVFELLLLLLLLLLSNKDFPALFENKEILPKREV